MLFFSILGLILVEQLIRNSEEEQRGKIIFFCISAGAVFSYDFFVFSNAFLVQEINYEYWSARGFINVLIVPTLLISAARNPSLSPEIHISRQFVFHTTTLLGSGIYLILMALAGYYIKIKSGDWGELLQSTFLFAALLLFASLFFSTKLKLKIKQYVNRSFSNKYDYREEWNRFSNTLLINDTRHSIYLRSLQAVGQIVSSEGGQLWLKTDQQYQYCAHWHIEPDKTHSIEPEQSGFINFIHQNRVIFTLQEYMEKGPPQTGSSHWLISNKTNWLILPLWVEDNLFGFIHLNTSQSQTSLDQEDRELLTTITHHVALYLSQHEVSKELQRAEKFKSINQLTAFLTHDLKTLLSQLFLLVENGKIHKHNPAFIDDMLDTLDHVSQKMQRLVNQLKDPAEKTTETPVSVLAVLNDILTDYKLGPVQPVIISDEETNFQLLAAKNELSSALKHIIQNAVDSVAGVGSVKIKLTSNNSDQISIKIIDNGKGMSQEFIANRLFQPFESTKGVSGMGIGVYQSREYIRSLGGDIQVASQPGEGTTFTITLPVKKQ
jgi:putative PEP-CTERM system histidine kinase